MTRYGRRSRYSRYSDDDYYGWKPYVPVAARRAQAERELATLGKNGRTTAPVHIDGRKIAHTFWGKAWCHNLERYSDFANRLPRGRTYVRNGSVVDLQIAPGSVTALVSGSALYRIQIAVKAVPKARWQGVCRDCSGAIDSLVELLQGRLSATVMSRICEPKTGLFPEPGDMSFECSCPDWASMCKHVAATLYGVGARLDERPDLLFLLRGVDQGDLLAKAAGGMPAAVQRPGDGRVLDSGDLGEMFGIEIAEPSALPRAQATRGKPTARVATSPELKPPVPTLKPAPRREMSAAERRAVSSRMKKYWEERGRRRQGKAAAPEGPVAAAAPKTSVRRWMSAAQRRAVSERMKKYWRERRTRGPGKSVAPAATTAPAVPKARRRKPVSAAQRRAVSERMKTYWEARRRAKAGVAAESPTAGASQPAPRRQMSVAQRRTVSERMKKYWEQWRRRRQQA